MKYLLFVILMPLSAMAAFGQASADSTNLISNFSINPKPNAIVLRWKTDSLPGGDSFFTIEKSGDGQAFTVAGITRTKDTGWTEYTDNSPALGNIFYRVKLSTGLTDYYSPVIRTSPMPESFCRFYPNPVDKVLIIKSDFAIDVLISDNTGKPLISDRLGSGLKVIDVSGLEPGIYVVTMVQKDNGRQFSEKLVKK